MSAATLAACDAAARRAREALAELGLATAEHRARLADLHRTHARLVELREHRPRHADPPRAAAPLPTASPAAVSPPPTASRVELPSGWGSLRSAWGREAERTHGETRAGTRVRV